MPSTSDEISGLAIPPTDLEVSSSRRNSISLDEKQSSQNGHLLQELKTLLVEIQTLERSRGRASRKIKYTSCGI
eukprot:TRINITY_DN8768_c0_g1_i1.p1 TRINITY_DN8768_c0_g1~~TRINITY_DN8768_c0_g1_i1.p1  ORF type:complete len:74 (+),score=9.53 TRINITY_DN8768_c0_g1_i1:73-294(+)